MSKRRIFMVGYSTDKGGVESYIRNLCCRLDADYDIILHWPVMEIDGKRWTIPTNRHNPIKYHRFWNQFFEENKFDVIYYNTCDIVSIDMLRFAKHANVPVRIIHAHSSGNQFPRSGLLSVLHKLMEKNSRSTLHKYATNLLACSKSAGDWMFDGRQYTIIKNGIDLSKYKFSKEYKESITSSFHQKTSLVVACIGRVEGEKNPYFSYEIFKEILRKNPTARCLFIGDGMDRADLERKVQSEGLSDRIIFTGGVDNVNEWLSYIDVVLMPSLFEGLPFALIEAQAAGVRSLVSDTVSDEVNITGLVNFMNLSESPSVWAENLIELAKQPRVDVSDKLKQAGFSIRQTAHIVKSIIEQKWQETQKS